MEHNPLHLLGKSAPSKSTKTDMDSVHKRVASQMKQSIEIQQELLKSIAVFRNALEAVAQASDDVAQSVGKFAVASMTSHNTAREFNTAHPPSESLISSEEEEYKQRQMNAALQQIIKYHTFLAQQQGHVVEILQKEFQRPINTNLEKYRDVFTAWEKEYEKDCKKKNQEIRQKEMEGSRLGRQGKADTERLSATLQELRLKIQELEETKEAKIHAALLIDHHQGLLVAHHLQQILRSEVQCFQNLSSYEGKSSAESLSIISRGSSIPSLTVPQPMPRLVTPQSSARQSEDSSHLLAPPVPEKSKTPVGGRMNLPVPPPRKQAPQPPAEFSYTQRRSVLEIPSIPQTNHRKTIIAPQNSDIETLKRVLDENVGRDKADQILLSTPKSERVLSDASQPRSFWSEQKENRASTLSNRVQKSINAILNGGNTDSDLALVLHDFKAQSEDDLDTLEGDVIQVLSIEGEWVYALLLMPSAPGSREYVPAQIDGRTPAGWVPLEFTCPLVLTPIEEEESHQ